MSGAWHQSAIFDDFRACLDAESVTITLPTAGSEPPVVDEIVDVVEINQTAQKWLIRAKRYMMHEPGRRPCAYRTQIVVITHSYAALPASEAIKGWDEQEIAQRGDLVGS